jgi:hypothetical protein
VSWLVSIKHVVIKKLRPSLMANAHVIQVIVILDTGFLACNLIIWPLDCLFLIKILLVRLLILTSFYFLVASLSRGWVLLLMPSLPHLPLGLVCYQIRLLLGLTQRRCFVLDLTLFLLVVLHP